MSMKMRHAGSAEKCELALKNGADVCINYRSENIVERVREITNGEGVPVVYDSVGKDTFEASLKCLRPCGLLASFGNASGGSQHPALKNDWMLRASRRCS